MSEFKLIVEALLMAADEPLSIARLQQCFAEHECPEKKQVREALTELMQDYTDRSIELKELASGFQFQAKQAFSQWVRRLWEVKPQRYSRATLETLAIIAYRQPVTRAEIEEIRGVVVSTNIIRTLQEREWIQVIGQRDVPGKPSLFGTTKQFLDDFNLTLLSQLPSLPEIQLTEENIAL